MFQIGKNVLALDAAARVVVLCSLAMTLPGAMPASAATASAPIPFQGLVPPHSPGGHPRTIDHGAQVITVTGEAILPVPNAASWQQDGNELLVFDTATRNPVPHRGIILPGRGMRAIIVGLEGRAGAGFLVCRKERSGASPNCVRYSVIRAD